MSPSPTMIRVGALMLCISSRVKLGFAGVRSGDRELCHALRVMDRHVEAVDPPVAKADDNGALDPQPAHQLDRVLGHVVVMERTAHGVGFSPTEDPPGRPDSWKMTAVGSAGRTQSTERSKSWNANIRYSRR
jgi:hypothetical protein